MGVPGFFLWLWKNYKKSSFVLTKQKLEKKEKKSQEDIDIINELKQVSNLSQHSFTILPFQNQSQMPFIYQKGDIFVLPSQGPGETWGLAINESMAAGCAVIAIDICGGAIELIEEGKNGYIFESNNEEDLVMKMQKFSKKGMILKPVHLPWMTTSARVKK
jgi:glycosyltransferase involved in cell wall biosynthesis